MERLRASDRSGPRRGRSAARRRAPAFLPRPGAVLPRHLASIFGASAQAAFDDYARAATGPSSSTSGPGCGSSTASRTAAFAALPRALIRQVLADRSGSGWAYCLHSLIDGQFDVDRLDYLLRDAANAGTEYGGIDTTRLLQSLELHRPGRDDWRIGLGARAVSSFETLLIQRAQHYRWVVHHPANVAADAALRRCTETVYELSGLRSGGSAGGRTARGHPRQIAGPGLHLGDCPTDGPHSQPGPASGVSTTTRA